MFCRCSRRANTSICRRLISTYQFTLDYLMNLQKAEAAKIAKGQVFVNVAIPRKAKSTPFSSSSTFTTQNDLIDAANDAEWREKGRGLPGFLRLVCVSDTHTMHSIYTDDMPTRMPKGDVLIHAGDFSYEGMPQQVESFAKWLKELPFQHKVVIAGNHDLTFDTENYPAIWQAFGHEKEYDSEGLKQLVKDASTYLENTETNINGVRIWGSPWTPRFHDWAFNADRGAHIRSIWDQIPDGVDIVVSHGPPLGRQDACFDGQLAGCADLLEVCQTRVKPRLCIFGHIHEGRGASFDGQTVYVNASSVNLMYHPVFDPIVIDLPVDRSRPLLSPAHLEEARKQKQQIEAEDAESRQKVA
eukprot:GDKI01009272.1.p1 GENE.GDKI01009272.1~~GDKI01009272.1.p1  ORF type:complete len:357 (+),score=62.70 GDKI01009272.1:149-1219(+)